MIYKPVIDTIKHPENKEIIVECDCKCKALHFMKFVDNIEPIFTDYIISLHGSSFMDEQDRGYLIEKRYLYVVNTSKGEEPVQLSGVETGQNKCHIILKLICKGKVCRRGYEFLILKRKWLK